MLIENTLFGVRNKTDEAIEFLKLHEPPEGYYVAFSGGKDSVVMLDLVRKSGVKHNTHFNLTSVDPPELIKFVRTHYPDIEFVKPKHSMYELIIKNGIPPTRRIRYCCRILKEHGGENRHVVTGVRREESSTRSKYKLTESDDKIIGKIHVRPILDWTELDVWKYIDENKLPYCYLYDEDGINRIGCVMCPMGGSAQMKNHAQRWPHIYRVYLSAFGKAIERRKQRGLPTYQHTAQEMMDWWLQV